MMAKNMTISTSNFFSPAAAPNAIPSAVVGGCEDGEGGRMGKVEKVEGWGRCEDGEVVEGGRMGKV